jgi:hypothetical protein
MCSQLTQMLMNGFQPYDQQIYQDRKLWHKLYDEFTVGFNVSLVNCVSLMLEIET